MSSDLVEMYRRMVLIREAEQTLVRLFAEARVPVRFFQQQANDAAHQKNST